MAFDGVPIDISNGLSEGRRFCLGRLSMIGLFRPSNQGWYTDCLGGNNTVLSGSYRHGTIF